jgi:hypothetical protein
VLTAPHGKNPEDWLNASRSQVQGRIGMVVGTTAKTPEHAKATILAASAAGGFGAYRATGELLSTLPWKSAVPAQVQSRIV